MAGMLVRTKWIEGIKVGDMLRARSGKLRVVRSVSHSESKHYGTRTIVIFTIQHCSWTGRCYTVYTGSDLRSAGYRPTGVNVSLRGKVDRMIGEEFGRRGSMAEAKLRCCDVIGIP